MSEKLTDLTVLALAADAKRLGADYSDLYIQNTAGHSVHFEDGKIEQLSSYARGGCGARVILDGQTFYSHRQGTSPAIIQSALNGALEASMLNTLPDGNFPNEPMFEDTKHPVQLDWDFIHRIDSNLRKESKYVKQVSISYMTVKHDIAIIDADENCVDETRERTLFFIHIVAEKDGILQTGTGRRYMSVPVGEFWDGSSPDMIAEDALRRALLMLEAKPCPAGVMNVLIDGEAGGTVIHEACGHGLEADIVNKSFSVYKGKIGERVANESVTLVDDPTLPKLNGHYKYDDEGTEASRTVLIENGVLKGYLSDIMSYMEYGVPKTGNGRRSSYSSLPIPRMSNTFLMPGNCEFGEMLEKTGDGLLVKRMGGGQVNPTTGDFVFHVSEAYTVESGKVKYPVKGAILTGNGPKMLNDIVALGKNLHFDPGTCGKSGQGVPVTDAQPTMLVRDMTVGGRDVSGKG